jgi:excisionase family DNA binding protein
MNVNGYRRWLLEQIKLFNDDSEFACDRANETVPVIQQAQRIAIELGLPEIARHCATVTTTMLALPTARLVLCECLAMLKPQTPYFDSTAAANYLGITEKSIYGLVERKRLTPLRGPRRTYRFTREQLDQYLAKNTKL